MILLVLLKILAVFEYHQLKKEFMLCLYSIKIRTTRSQHSWDDSTLFRSVHRSAGRKRLIRRCHLNASFRFPVVVPGTVRVNTYEHLLYGRSYVHTSYRIMRRQQRSYYYYELVYVPVLDSLPTGIMEHYFIRVGMRLRPSLQLVRLFRLASHSNGCMRRARGRVLPSSYSGMDESRSQHHRTALLEPNNIQHLVFNKNDGEVSSDI